jgi:dihydroorotate dehydrogenase (fumarate)
MDLSTTYLGLALKNPLMPSSSPLTGDLDEVKKMEDAGAAAVVLPSLFEEQLLRESDELQYHMAHGTESFAEALSYFPNTDEFLLGPEEYLAFIRKAKSALAVPVIASLNGTTPGGWIGYAKNIEAAGASALELNIYSVPTDPDLSESVIETNLVDILKAVKASVKIPVAVKISPFYTNPARVVKRIADAGANGVVLFNSFYEPDIDLETLDILPKISFGHSYDMRLAMRWTAILHDKVSCDIAAAGGVQTTEDVVKMLLVGANAVQICSALYRNGVSHFATLLKGLSAWMEKREYASVGEMRGSMSHKNVEHPQMYERAQYMRAVREYKG